MRLRGHARGGVRLAEEGERSVRGQRASQAAAPRRAPGPSSPPTSRGCPRTSERSRQRPRPNAIAGSQPSSGAASCCRAGSGGRGPAGRARSSSGSPASRSARAPGWRSPRSCSRLRADVVGLADGAALEHEVDRAAVVVDMEPLALVGGRGVHRQAACRRARSSRRAGSPSPGTGTARSCSSSC